jgi:hypothetical protein
MADLRFVKFIWFTLLLLMFDASHRIWVALDESSRKGRDIPKKSETPDSKGVVVN